jgi:hypothetical protein
LITTKCFREDLPTLTLKKDLNMEDQYRTWMMAVQFTSNLKKSLHIMKPFYMTSNRLWRDITPLRLQEEMTLELEIVLMVALWKNKCISSHLVITWDKKWKLIKVECKMWFKDRTLNKLNKRDKMIYSQALTSKNMRKKKCWWSKTHSYLRNKDT